MVCNCRPLKAVFACPDELRLAVRDALCRTEKRKQEFKDAVFSLEATEGPIGRYPLSSLCAPASNHKAACHGIISFIIKMCGGWHIVLSWCAPLCMYDTFTVVLFSSSVLCNTCSEGLLLPSSVIAN